MDKRTNHQTLCEDAFASLKSGNEIVAGRLLQIHPVNLSAGMILIDKDCDRFVIGREEDCDLTIFEQAISRKHLVVSRSADGFMLQDLQSTNGTYVNGQQVTTLIVLTSGDRINIGSRIFKFIATDEVEAQYYQAVYSMMTKDSLTGAWNKQYFVEILQRELKRRVRSQRSFGLLMVDFDHFKAINDEHGHLVGDEVLVEMVRRLQSSIREEDILARYGGEEFAIIATEVDKVGGMQVAQRCLDIISQAPFETSQGPIECSVSIGLAIANEDNSPSLNEFVSLADEKLYVAKNNGRNQIQCYD